MKKISFVALILLFSMIISSCGLITPGGSDPTTTTEAPYTGEYEIRLTAIGSTTIKAGKTVQIRSSVTGTTSKDVTFTSSNPEIATVSEKGLVTGISAGTATITCSLVIEPACKKTITITVEAAIKHVGPVYMRFGRLAVSVINDKPDYKFEIGKGKMLADGNDVTIVATGIMVEQALIAREMLLADGISAAVINIHTIKPLDKEILIAAAQQTGAIVTTEEHNVIGGLGSAVCEALAGVCPVPVIRHGVEDIYGKSAPAKELLDYYKLNAEGICEKVKIALSMKIDN